MSDKKFEVPGGDSLDVTLRRKRRSTTPPPAPRVEPSGLIAPDDEGTRYVFRGQPQIIFLDLGTRLRSVPESPWAGDRVRTADETSSPATRDDYFDEYVEIVYERAAPVKLAAPSLAEVQALDRLLLGSRAAGSADTLDPFGTTPANVTGRKLFNCMPLIQDSHWLYATVGVSDKTFKLSADDGEKPDEWQRRKESDADGEEHWNARNLAADVAFGAGLLKLKGAIRSLRVVAGDYASVGLPRAVGAYEEFDTDDGANFKVTSAPSFDAPATPLRLASGAAMRVYLKPRFLRYELTTSDPLAPFRWDGRVPVYPDLFVFRNSGREADLAAKAMCAVRRSPLASAYYDAHPPSGSAVLVWPTFTAANVPPVITPAGALAAAVAQGQKVCYVWRLTARALDFAHDLNPFEGGLALDVPCS